MMTKKRIPWEMIAPLALKKHPKREQAPLSPEVIPVSKWMSQLGKEGVAAFTCLKETNGDTGTPPEQATVVWGLRSKTTGRWLNHQDESGVDCLQVFGSRKLAEDAQGRLNHGYEVVWMQVAYWWRKVEDAARTGYPLQVHLVVGTTEDHTAEHVYSCKDLAAAPGGLEQFMTDLQESRYPNLWPKAVKKILLPIRRRA